MIKKAKSTKTKRVTNADLELDVVNPVITAGVIDPLQPVVLTDEELERLKLRKKLELDLVKKFDKDTISRKECWFLMDSEWLNKWSTFVSSESEDIEPGPVTTSGLYDSTDGKLLPNLRSRIDYRGVNPLVYYIFVQLYGKDKSPELPRYLVDIYGPVVDDGHLAKSQYIAQVRLIIMVISHQNDSELQKYIYLLFLFFEWYVFRSLLTQYLSLLHYCRKKPCFKSTRYAHNG